ncbi:hypothetical protein HYPSUDRAFT_37854 [Hypholoma sublateritium FD-334 SS-4]|uniref:Uncharacterized protein n=1 Tax=Hypholoma sublateritium (strain FD-334 SS-4) TaxID=945553 RepID=A0A0D2LD83_HYPSF|nr:hypothetical protein HYPSUDRAFT_37854 [Hypholoma sublateritium FD-334 SS-4]
MNFMRALYVSTTRTTVASRPAPDALSFKARQLLLHGGPASPRAFHRALLRLHANDALYAHAEEGRFENLARVPSPDIEAQAEAGGDGSAHTHTHTPQWDAGRAALEITAADFYPGAVPGLVSFGAAASPSPKLKSAAAHHRDPRGFARTRWPYSYAQSSLEFGFRSGKAGAADRRLLAGSYIAVGVLTLICFVVIAHHIDM